MRQKSIKIDIHLEAIIPLEDFSINKALKIICRKSCEAAKRGFLSMLSQIENYLVENLLPGVVKNSRKKYKFTAFFGTVQYPYWQMLDKSTGKYFNMLNRFLGIRPHQRVADHIMEMGILAASMLSFRKAVKFIAPFVQ